MDNLTHALTGWNLGRLYPEDWGAWVTPTAILAANLPDLEIALISPADKPTYLMWHRVWSHCLVGVALELAALTLVLTAVAWFLKTRVPALRELRWWRVLAVAVPGAASHLMMDWWNSYGIQPLFPFDSTRIYGDMVFIVDPWLWLMLGSGVLLGTNLQNFSRKLRAGMIALGSILLTVCGMIVYSASQSELVPGSVAWVWFVCAGVVVVLRFRDRFPASPLRRWYAATALIAMCGYVTVLGAWSAQAKQLALREFEEHSSVRANPLVKSSVNPQPAVPWRFEVLLDTGDRVFQYSTNSLRKQARLSMVHPTNRDLPELRRLEETREVQAWRTFARHPVVKRTEEALKLGDVRYQLAAQRDDWSEQTIPLER